MARWLMQVWLETLLTLLDGAVLIVSFLSMCFSWPIHLHTSSQNPEMFFEGQLWPAKIQRHILWIHGSSDPRTIPKLQNKRNKKTTSMSNLKPIKHIFCFSFFRLYLCQPSSMFVFPNSPAVPQRRNASRWASDHSAQRGWGNSQGSAPYIGYIGRSQG